MLHEIALYLFEGLEYGIHFYVEDMVDSFKAYIPAEGDKERDTINKEQIYLQTDIFM